MADEPGKLNLWGIQHLVDSGYLCGGRSPHSNMKPSCIVDEVLAAYGRGELSEKVRQYVASHLADCEACAARSAGSGQAKTLP